MRSALVILALVFVGQAAASGYYYKVLDIPSIAGAHFSSPDAGCQSAYQFDQSLVYPGKVKENDELTPKPYQSPYVYQSIPPRLLSFHCDTGATITHHNDDGTTFDTDYTQQHTILRFGNECKDGEQYNSATGICVKPGDEQIGKELGDPSGSVGTVSCADPINIGIGNVFEEETDYKDVDGELSFRRSYNSLTGDWNHSYSASIFPDVSAVLISFADDRQTYFGLEDGIAIPELGERGSMEQKGGQWIYRSPLNEVMKFESPRGRLLALTNSQGVTQTIAYATDSSFNTIATVTDSRGHKLKFKTKITGQLLQMEAGSLVVSYQYDSAGRLIAVSRQWPDHASTRRYLYEDDKNPDQLTAIVDERGVVSARWTYDDSRRAISNERGDGADKVTVEYGTDGSAKVTNALGHSTTYHYEVVQGVKRVIRVDGAPAAACPASNSRYTYTSLGETETITDARGFVTRFTYDELGRETRRVDAEGTSDERVTSTRWDGSSFRRESVIVGSKETKFQYDASGRLVATSVHTLAE